jgi:hypothetical protein
VICVLCVCLCVCVCECVPVVIFIVKIGLVVCIVYACVLTDYHLIRAGLGRGRRGRARFHQRRSDDGPPLIGLAPQRRTSGVGRATSRVATSSGRTRAIRAAARGATRNREGADARAHITHRVRRVAHASRTTRACGDGAPCPRHAANATRVRAAPPQHHQPATYPRHLTTLTDIRRRTHAPANHAMNHWTTEPHRHGEPPPTTPQRVVGAVHPPLHLQPRRSIVPLWCGCAARALAAALASHCPQARPSRIAHCSGVAGI